MSWLLFLVFTNINRSTGKNISIYLFPIDTVYTAMLNGVMEKPYNEYVLKCKVNDFNKAFHTFSAN